MLNKITDGDLAGKGVIGLPDVPGLPAEEMQAKFEETAREVIVPKFNGLVNQLASSTAASELGAIDPTTKGAAKVQDALNSLNEKMSNIKVEGYAPERHASVDDKYGAGSNVAYGHVKLSDSAVGTEDVADGVAATPKAVAAVREMAAIALEEAEKAADETKNVVRTTEQSLTNSEKEQVRANIGAAAAGAKPVAHNSLTDEFGPASHLAYGHVKLSDSADDALGADSGVAVTPKALYGAVENAVAGAVGNLVSYDAQKGFTDDQKAEARRNIGAASHSDLVEVHSIATSAGQQAVNASSAAGEAARSAAEAKIQAGGADVAATSAKESAEAAYRHSVDALNAANSAVREVNRTKLTEPQVLSAAERDNARKNINAVSYEAADLTEAQKRQARENIGAASTEDVGTSSGGTSYAVTYVEQDLTDVQKYQARKNIGAADAAFVAEVEKTAAEAKTDASAAYNQSISAISAAATAEMKSDNANAAVSEIRAAAVSYDAQSVSSEKQAQARENIWAPPIKHDDVTGKYGAGGRTKYGHVIIQDEINETATVGVAASPEGVARAIANAVRDKAPKDHATEENVYGLADALKYGHVRLTNSISSSFSEESGYAATPRAVALVKDMAEGAVTAANAAEAASKDGVKYSLQSLTADQKSQARSNIGAAEAGAKPVAHADYSGNYGKATFSLFGHVRLMDNAEKDYTAEDGNAVTPYALWKETSNRVSVEAQELTEEQKAQARANIGAAAVGEGGGWVQPDWEAAEGADGHIKNRTHWKDWEYVEVVPIKDVHLQNVGTVPYGVDATTGAYANVVEGSKVSVYWDGKWYNCTAFVSGGSVSIGNYSVISSTGANTGEPFFLQKSSADKMRFYPKIRYDSYSYGLKLAEPVYHKLPKEYLPDDIGGGATPDWNAAEGEPGHILNRTHWFEQNGVLLEETNAESFTHPSFGKMWMINKAPELKVGETYTVKYNGTSYNCVCQAAPAGLIEDTSAVAMGNFSVVGGANTGEPFAMLISHTYQEVDIIDLTGSASVQVEIRGEVYHKIDPKFLPNTSYVYVAKFLEGEGDDQQPFYVSCPVHELAMKLIDPNCIVQAKILYYFRENDETPIMEMLLSPSVTGGSFVEFYSIYNGAIATVRVNEDGTFEFTTNEIQG